MEISFIIRNLSERAVLVEFGQKLDIEANSKVIQLRDKLHMQPFPGIIDTIISYSALTIIYDPFIIKKELNLSCPVSEWVRQNVMDLTNSTTVLAEMETNLVRIPVWYPHGPDLIKLAEAKGRTPNELIECHFSQTYRVYMLGFQPGFAYMGTLPELLQCPRKEKPVPVKAGSVAIAGEQTGIYPVNSPGGWHVLGFTPWIMFQPERENPVWLNPGDMVQFYPVSAAEFEYLEHQSKNGNDIAN